MEEAFFVFSFEKPNELYFYYCRNTEAKINMVFMILNIQENSDLIGSITKK